MSVRHSSRELSERVEQDFQKRPNRFRRAVWWLSLWMAAGCLLWLGFEGARGEYRLFESGDLAAPHRFFENDCAKCHTTWAPLERAVRFDSGASISSVENDACLKCHPGAAHHDNQMPAHREFSCAYCHNDHLGNHDLKRVANRVCVDCHRELKTATGSNSFATSVTGFDRPDGHPEFAFARLRSELSATPDGIGPAHRVLKLLKFDAEHGWRDRAEIRFNHSAHLKSEHDSSGRLVYGLIGKDQRLGENRFSDLSQTCSVCHQLDDAGQYLKPIRFEQHCGACHPLYFDNQNFPQQQVPHAAPEIVRGFLTEKYTLAALHNPDAVEVERPARPVPGRGFRPSLSREQAGYLDAQLQQAERHVLRHKHALFGKEASGGCAYCHTVENQDEPEQWKIVPPNIPDRWQPHARFDHQIHELLNCAECHGSVNESKLTGDVLLPGAEVCRKCHSHRPLQPGPESPVRYFGARTDCVECHNYHDHSRDNFTGSMNPKLEQSAHASGGLNRAE